LFTTTLGAFAVGGALSVTTVDDTVVFVSAATRLVDKKTTIKVITARFKNVFINYLILV
jgi:hypothetical protein